MSRATTTCPNCGTTFRVKPDQLSARLGQVRCGRCRHVFNGYDALSVSPDTEVTAANSRFVLAATEPQHPLAQIQRRRPAVEGDRGVPTYPGFREGGSPDPMRRSLTALGDGGATGGEPRRRWGGRWQRAIRHEILDEAPGNLWQDLERDQRRRRGLLALGVALAACALVGTAFASRGLIAQWYPELRPSLSQACASVGCTIPLAHEADQWSIEASELRADPARPQVVILQATLRNRARFVQAYPNLDLTLTDLQDAPLERRVLTPVRYLPKGREPDQGVDGNSELNVKVEMPAGKRGASGYRLSWFYP